MKVLQLIDTLNAGGAERMAVNYANMLSQEFGQSYLATTRTSGVLQKELNENVSYTNLDKKKTIDFKAIRKFKTYLKQNDIDIVHAHTTSYFFAVLAKLFLPRLKIVWHDHHGNRVNAKFYKQIPIIFSSLFFNGVICVNETLLGWTKKNLFCKHTAYLQNFLSSNIEIGKETALKGIDNKRIIKVANLRHPKNHLMLLQAFKQIVEMHPDWTLHLVGKDYEDGYSETLRDYIRTNNMQNKVFIYGLKNDISNILSQVSIGVITSTSEGLPMALLEYGNKSLGVITTDVGKCGELIEGRGIVVSDIDAISIAQAMDKMIDNTDLRKDYSKKIKEYIDENFTEKAILKRILLFYKSM